MDTSTTLDLTNVGVSVSEEPTAEELARMLLEQNLLIPSPRPSLPTLRPYYRDKDLDSRFEVAMEMSSTEGLPDELGQKIQALQSFNIVFVGESGLGKSTLQADLFRSLESMDIQLMKQGIAEIKGGIDAMVDEKDRYEAMISAAMQHKEDEKGARLRNEQDQLKEAIILEVGRLSGHRSKLRSRLNHEVRLRKEASDLMQAVRVEASVLGDSSKAPAPT